MFQLDSVTKQFTATLVMQVMGQRRLATNTPVSSILTDAPATWQGITIAHLLSHTAGVTDALDRDYGFGWSIKALRGGGRRVHHNGGGFGYATAIYRWLDAAGGDVAIIVLTNKQAGKNALGWSPQRSRECGGVRSDGRQEERRAGVGGALNRQVSNKLRVSYYEQVAAET